MNTRPNAWAVLLVILVLPLVGCGGRVLVSEPVGSPTEAGEPGGLVYALPRTLLRIEAEIPTGQSQVRYTFTPVIMGDATARFRARFDGSAWADNALDVQADANGLLTSGTSTVTDQRGQIVLEVSRLAARFVSPFSALMRDRQPPTTEPNPYPFSVSFWAEDLTSLRRLPDGGQVQINAPFVASSVPVAVRCPYSLCYRSLAAAQVNFTPPGAGQARPLFINVVDTSRVEGIDHRSATLVSRQNQQNFTSGLLTRHVINQPSTALAVVRLPNQALGAFTESLGNLLTVRVTETQATANLLQQQNSVLANQITLMQTQQRLQVAIAQQRRGL